MGKSGRIVRVDNISHSTSLYQLEKFFNYIGQIEDIKIYPSENSPIPVEAKICFVKYREPEEAYVASFLNGSTFIDRMLVVSLYPEDRIPSEERGLEMAGAHTIQPIPVPGAVQMVNPPFDPDLAQLGLPQPPPLPASIDPVTIERIRRTIYVGNLNPSILSGDKLLEYFSQVGSINYVALAQGETGDSFDEQFAAYIEFSSRSSILPALKMNGTEYESRKIIVNHSGALLNAPLFPCGEIARSELKLAAKQYKDAEFIIRVFIEPDKVTIPKARSPSPAIRPKSSSLKREESRKSKASRSRSRRSRKKSSSKKRSSRHSSRYRSRSKKRRSRSKKKSVSRSRDKDRGEKSERRSKRSSSKDRKKEGKDNKKRSRSRKRSRSGSKKRDRSKRSSSRSRKKKDDSQRDKEKKRKRSRSNKKSDSKRKRSVSRDKEKNGIKQETSPQNSVNVKLDYDEQDQQSQRQISSSVESESSAQAKVKEEYLDEDKDKVMNGNNVPNPDFGSHISSANNLQNSNSPNVKSEATAVDES